jgi:hypothetical protein
MAAEEGGGGGGRGAQATPKSCTQCSSSDVVKLQTHAVVDLVVLQRDVVLEDAVPATRRGVSVACNESKTCESDARARRGGRGGRLPLLQPDLFRARSRLRCDQLL